MYFEWYEQAHRRTHAPRQVCAPHLCSLLYFSPFVLLLFLFPSQIVEVLCFMHHPSRRLIHRDIKPENVLVCGDGTIKVADFGITRAMEGRTRVHTNISTIEYSSPELV